MTATTPTPTPPASSIPTHLKEDKSTTSSSRSSIADVDSRPHTPPSEVVEAEIAGARNIPSDFKSSLKAWWGSSQKGDEESEIRLLRRLPFFRLSTEPPLSPTPSNPNPITARLAQVHLPSTSSTASTTPASSNASTTEGERMINTVIFDTPATRGSKEAVVLTHGYGAGTAFFYRNWEALAEASAQAGRAAYSIDWLGMGRSSRPSPKELYAGKKATTKERVEKAENFFLDSLDQWREKMGIEKMTLIGHSLGGYLSAAYALKHPERVDRLILLSPAGIPDHPDKGEDIPDPDAIAAASTELHDSQQKSISSPPAELAVSGTDEERQALSPGASKLSRPAAPATRASLQNAVKAGAQPANGSTPSNKQSALRKVWVWAWEQGYSPFGIVRNIGPWGPMMVGRYSTRRFSALPEEDIKDLHEYCWAITRAKGSSEYCISHLLAPGAYARWPIVSRVHKLKIPVVFSYGDHDWMDISGGREAVKRMREAGNMNGKVVEIDHAGHHLYLDNPKRTNALLRSEILAAARESREAAAARA